MLHSTDNKNRH